MKSKRILKGFGLLVLGSFLYISPARAEEAPKEKVTMSREATLGKEYFEGTRRFSKGGPACITCHNVTNDDLIPGGKFSTKDLTAVYDRMGESIKDWLQAPGFPAMETSYSNHPLSESERVNLTAFFKYANAKTGYDLFYIGGGVGLAGILILISLLWMKRKKQMVKKDIFARQNSAWDAKH